MERNSEKVHNLLDAVCCRIGNETSIKIVTDIKTIPMSDGSLHYMYQLDWEQWVSSDCLSVFVNDEIINKMCKVQKYLSGNLDK